MSVRFTQSCPTCGRRLQIRASLLGCTIACQHCQAEFIADAESGAAQRCADAVDGTDPLMLRVEKLLEKASQPSTIS